MTAQDTDVPRRDQTTEPGEHPASTAVPDRRSGRWRRWAIVLCCVVLVLAGLGYAGYRYLLTTEWGVFFTLFADDERADNFRTMDQIFPSRDITAGSSVWELERAERDLPASYDFEGETHDLDAFLDRTETTGLVVLHDGALVHEQYREGYDAESRATSWSMAKSMVSALIGIAIEDGHIDGLDDQVTAYVPELTGSGYDGATIRDLITMSSGVDFDEGYDSTFADINMIFVRAMGFGEPMLDYYASLERAREPGTFNDYISSDTGVLAAVLAEATGQPVASYLEAEVWQPAGMEGDAFWSMDRTDTEIGFCCMNATLRDYARFGQLYLDDGVRDGQRILPDGWVEASTNPEAPRLEPGDNPASSWTFGYGYQWWIPEDRVNGEFTAIGVWGQYVYVDPTNRVVIAKSSTDGAFDDNDHESIAAFRAIAQEVAR
jgi:CubicO group peptidase (beta-lactamase class C family)